MQHSRGLRVAQWIPRGSLRTAQWGLGGLGGILRVTQRPWAAEGQPRNSLLGAYGQPNAAYGCHRVGLGVAQLRPRVGLGAT